jgi:hypothetical protein
MASVAFNKLESDLHLCQVAEDGKVHTKHLQALNCVRANLISNAMGVKRKELIEQITDKEGKPR